MILRKRAKGGDPVLYEILNKRNIHNFRDDEDFKRLEATVRKYLNDLKSAEREEQIRRYKNTLKSYRSSCEVANVICRSQGTRRMQVLKKRSTWWKVVSSIG